MYEGCSTSLRILEMEIKSQWHGTRLFKNLPQTSENYVRPQEFSYIAGGNVHVPSPSKEHSVMCSKRCARGPHATRQQRHATPETWEARSALRLGTRNTGCARARRWIPNRRTLETNQGRPRAGAQTVPIHRRGTRRTPQLRADRDRVP